MAKTKTTKKKKIEKEIGLNGMFNRKELQDTLAVCLDFVQKNYGNPILHCVHISAKGDTCTVSATDLEKAFTKELSYTGNQIDACIPVDMFVKEIKALDDDIEEVKLDFDGGKVVINNRCEILLTVSPEEYPVIPQPRPEDREIEVKGLSTKLKSVIRAADKDGHGAVICFDTEKGNIVANDGKRLHLEKMPVQKGVGQLIITRGTALIIAKYNDVNSLIIADKTIRLGIAGGTMITQLMEGEYPKYEAVIPKQKDLPIKVQFSGGRILQLMNGVVPIINQDYRLVKLTINGRLDIEAARHDCGSYKWHMPCTSKGKGETPLAIGINAQFLVDAVRAYTSKESDTVTIKLKAPDSALLINERAVIMPMKLTDC